MMFENEMTPTSVAAIVVLFHPPPGSVRRLLAGIREQVNQVWLIDNTPAMGEAADPEWKAAGVVFRALGENRGIAAAQNAGIREALAAGSTHVLLLDQDSFLPPGTVEALLAGERRLLGRGMAVAAVGPVFVDEKTGLRNKTHHHRWLRLVKPFVPAEATEPLETDWLIASGSLVRSEVLMRIGLMREELFIDGVDMEWGLRARSLGLRSFIVPTARISHSIGDAFIKLLGVSVMVHSEVRNYYMARNWMYLLRLRTMGARWRSGLPLHLAKFLLVHTWFATPRHKRATLFVRALWDGAFGRMGPYRPWAAQKP